MHAWQCVYFSSSSLRILEHRANHLNTTFSRSHGGGNPNLSRGLVIGMVMIGLTLAGCSNAGCTKQVVSLTNSQGTRTAVLEVSGCGGATVGYATDLKIVTIPKPMFGGIDYVWTARGWVDAELKWITPTRLEVYYPASLGDDVVHKVVRSSGVDISYVAQGM